MKITRRQLRRIIKENFWSTKKIQSVNDVQTVGDLRKLIASAQGAKQWEQTKGEAGDMVKDAIVDEILGKIPGASAAKSLFGFVKASYELPDESRTGTALDALDVDDPVAEIVDDPIENKFLKVFSKELEDMDGNTPISNLNMTELLSKFIAKHFDARTVTGFTEGAPKMKITKRQLRRIIRESLPYRKGQPWTDPKAPVGKARAEDFLDRELTDEEIEAAEEWEPADPAGDDDFWTGYGDATDGKGLPTGASPDYKVGWEDGNLNRVTERITRRQLRQVIKEEKAKILRESIPGEESPKLRQAAADLGSLMAGQPPTAYAVADALKGRYPGAAKDLLAAYNKAQAWIDLEYMD